MMELSIVKNSLAIKQYMLVFLLLLSILGFGQVDEFTKRIDRELKPHVISQTEILLLTNDSIINRDSVMVYPLYLCRQDTSNVDKLKYSNYSFLNNLQWMALSPNYSMFPFELMVSDLVGNLKYVSMRNNNLRTHSWIAEYTDSNGDEVLKKLLVKLLHDGIFDYAFVTSVPVIEEKNKEIHQQGRDGLCFCIKNEQIYVLFRGCQLYTMEEFIKLYWDWFDVKTADTYSD